ncbi:MAG TPA: vWA domain-containing protein [Polyangiaceae bacterium]|nr:vWA domain-containing protein [Polyangiaceae bacterium]
MQIHALIRRRIRLFLALAGLTTSAIVSCSQAADTDSQIGDHAQAGSSGTSHGGSAAGGDSGAVGSATGGMPDLVLSMGGDAGGADAGNEVCDAQVREGQRVPLDMYFLVDSSGSMADQVSGGSKWDVVSTALTRFLEDPRNTGTGVGIGYFPAEAGSCSSGQSGCFCIPLINLCFATGGGSCAVSDYATPAVPLALPPQPADVVSDIDSHQIGGGTPTRPALEGALQYLSQWASAHPERKPLLVLATDGEPVGCDPNTPQDVADVAARALAGPNAIRTFVIGVGSSLVSLNLVAQAGGTDHAFLVDTGGDVAKEFADALEQIRGTVASCDFIIPDTGSGSDPIDPKKVNVSYVAKGGSSPTRVPQTFMGDPSNCDSNGGWYYDDPKSPTMIKLCDATCQSLSSGAIQVEFGCDTVEQPPR